MEACGPDADGVGVLDVDAAKAADAVIEAREEINLVAGDVRPGARHLDRVGVSSAPPAITFYEAKGGDSTFGGSALVDGVRHEQGPLRSYRNSWGRIPI